MTDTTLLEVEDVRVHFPGPRPRLFAPRKTVKAVDGVSLQLKRGETLALVGESGCGKSTLGRAILQIERATSGSIKHSGVEVTDLSEAQLRPMRRNMQMVFQDPYSSLNPYLVVAELIAEPLRAQGVSAADRDRRILELVDAVRLRRDVLASYPHELSGGMRQRVGIARALALDPELIVCDEPIAALDVSVQAQIINLLQDLQQERNLSYLFISHDLGVVRHLADRVAVMYLGRIVEVAATNELFSAPKHPYTKALLSAIPRSPHESAALGVGDEIILSGDLPSPLDPPSGCAFRTRCPIAKSECADHVPTLVELAPGHFSTDCPCYVPGPNT